MSDNANEPVAWGIFSHSRKLYRYCYNENAAMCTADPRLKEFVKPLYTHPLRELSDDEIAAAIRTDLSGFFDSSAAGVVTLDLEDLIGVSRAVLAAAKEWK